MTDQKIRQTAAVEADNNNIHPIKFFYDAFATDSMITRHKEAVQSKCLMFQALFIGDKDATDDSTRLFLHV